MADTMRQVKMLGYPNRRQRVLLLVHSDLCVLIEITLDELRFHGSSQFIAPSRAYRFTSPSGMLDFTLGISYGARSPL